MFQDTRRLEAHAAPPTPVHDAKALAAHREGAPGDQKL
jgi:hypothetical protein